MRRTGNIDNCRSKKYDKKEKHSAKKANIIFSQLPFHLLPTKPITFDFSCFTKAKLNIAPVIICLLYRPLHFLITEMPHYC